MLADDICAISLAGDGKPIVMPAYPQLNLWADALEKIGAAKENLCRPRGVIEKYRWPAPADYSPQPLALHAVYEMQMAKTVELRLDRVEEIQKIVMIQNNTFQRTMLASRPDKKQAMQLIFAAAHEARMGRVAHPCKPYLLSELADLVEQDW